MVPIIFLRGAGEMASGIALALWRQGFSRLVLQECARPTAIRRAVCFSEAVYEGTARVHGLLARHVASPSLCAACWQQGEIALLTGSEDAALTVLRPQVFIEATLRKRGAPLEKSWAAFVLALGPGFLVYILHGNFLAWSQNWRIGCSSGCFMLHSIRIFQQIFIIFLNILFCAA